jgi:hypothetical protein
MVVALATAALVLGILTPAQADDPETAELVPMWGGECLNASNLPAASPDHQYLQSYYSVTCNAYSGYRIIRMHTDAKYGASDGAGWTQYSNGIWSKGNGVNGPTGTITYNLFTNACHWGGDWNFYRRTVTLEVTFERISTHTQYVDTRTFYRATGSRIPCGDHE